ncbi:Txe/YoeB family addiction module toxin [Asticcacaulis sp. BYS171W]|uniref:Putative mRNA interferase YoeB n=1 Tax=Asticcacaulis aquaticus TaxID=2984212 RepID=A0ABT5HVB4_9CAUL|nr:Txe/YoeB family addiction module toxin [Asticcacaulis aquaticus]MDC7684026.1 Txe/YoeB family addiction module toxin [Asticcacaulis aquaticus]
MKIVFSSQAWDDYLHWQSTDKAMLKRLNALIKDITRHPFEGIGQPEPLKHEWSGFWSRRIDQEHRIIYEVSDDSIYLAQCRYHY